MTGIEGEICKNINLYLHNSITENAKCGKRQIVNMLLIFSPAQRGDKRAGKPAQNVLQ